MPFGRAWGDEAWQAHCLALQQASERARREEELARQEEEEARRAEARREA